MPETRQSALRAAAVRLEKAGIETPARDAKALLLDAEGIDTAGFLANPDADLRDPPRFWEAIDRRLRREPVAKIVGARRFWKHCFAVTPEVLDPRPETELLVSEAIKAASAMPPPRILDLGTGSGCILLSILADLPDATGVGTDISESALTVAKQNAQRLNLTERADFLWSDWLEGVDGTFDLVVCNPPYISESERAALSPEVVDWDPEEALFAGMDGLQAYRRIFGGLQTALKYPGVAILEMGAGQARAVGSICREAGFEDIAFRKDLEGRERCLVIRQ